MTILQFAYQFRLQPTKEQTVLLSLAQSAKLGCVRSFKVWNYFLGLGKSLSYAKSCQELTLLKSQQDFIYLNNCPSQALQKSP